MTTQTVTALELTAERPEMVRSIIELIMADTISTYLDDDEYTHLRHLLIQPGEDIVEKYRQVTASIFLFDEYHQLLPLVAELVDNIGTDLFTDMLDIDENAAFSEILRCFGHGVSFWDNHNYQDFGFSNMPRLEKTFENPYNVASQILYKIEAKDSFDNSFDNEIMEEDKFDEWLAENYKHSGGGYYLSNNPNDYLMYEWHTLREQWEKEYYIQELPDKEEEDKPDNVTTFQIPEYYLSLIFNGEVDGYEQEDIKAWEQFEQQMIADGFTNGHWSYPDNYESYFSHSNDVHRFGDNVVDLQWVEMST